MRVETYLAFSFLRTVYFSLCKIINIVTYVLHNWSLLKLYLTLNSCYYLLVKYLLEILLLVIASKRMGVETNAASLCRKRVKQPSLLGKEGVNNNYPQLFIAENQETVKTFIS